MSLKISMRPHLSELTGVGGINTVIRKYFEHLPAHGIELVDPGEDFDVLAIHIGTDETFSADVPLVAHNHGLYWTAHYDAPREEHATNAQIVNLVRQADMVTVPSLWVARPFQRDMHLNPLIVPHGVDLGEWDHEYDAGGYVLWNKNRADDICDPTPLMRLAERHPEIRFVTTFAVGDVPDNVTVTGRLPYDEMRDVIKCASVYLSTAQETFGIGVLEAMAARVPVLAYNTGHVPDIVHHLKSGYVARNNDIDDLSRGLTECLGNRERYGDAGREIASTYTWKNACERVALAYRYAYKQTHLPRSVSVVIPCYNKAETLARAVSSVAGQTLKPERVIIVDNNSTDDTHEVCRGIQEEFGEELFIELVEEKAQGVAHARNAGVDRVENSAYVACLDADDEMGPDYLRSCVSALESDRSLGAAYTKMLVVDEGYIYQGRWPQAYNFGAFMRGENQVPSGAVFRKKVFDRLGGYRPRYCPRGAGTEDAEFFLRMGAAGYPAQLASEDFQFAYYEGGYTANPDYKEPNWRRWHPWTRDGQHPFASCAAPENGLWHPVRHYERPAVSVIIPIGPGHEPFVIDALDSLEAQTFRNWEAIVVFDAPGDGWEKIVRMYPYARMHFTKGRGRGPAAARNIGAARARASLLMFLDADDWLVPEAMNRMLDALHQNPNDIIYSDYYGHATIDSAEAVRLRNSRRLVGYDPKTERALVRHMAFDYDCERAQAQPDPEDMYIWSLVTMLIPRAYHDSIGGFDEDMESWEDWDYQIRLAREGLCFHRINAPLVHYRFDTGTRRARANPDESGDSGRQLSSVLLEYLQEKRGDSVARGCGGCGGRGRNRQAQALRSRPMFQLNNAEKGRANMPDAFSLVRVKLTDGNRAEHVVAIQGTNYSYRKDGDEFLMQRDHAENLANIGRVEILEEVEGESAGEATKEASVPEEKPSPEVVEPDDLTEIWGINEERAKKLNEAGVKTVNGLLTLSESRIRFLLDVSETISSRIVTEARKVAEKK